VRTLPSPSIAFALLALLGFGGGGANAEHGTTDKLEASRKAFEKRFSGKVLNERLPQLWSEDGSELFIELETAPGERQWHAVSRSSGETRPLDGKPGNVASNDKQKSKKAPASNNRQSPDKRYTAQIRNGQLILERGDSA
jgi:hypothetical protein